jgi:hypothetical protein
MSLSALALASVLTLFSPQDRGSALDRAFEPSCDLFGTGPRACPQLTVDETLVRVLAEPVPPCLTLPPLAEADAALADRARRAASQRRQDRDPDLAGLLRALPALKAALEPHRTCATSLDRARHNRELLASALRRSFPRCVGFERGSDYGEHRVDEACLASALTRGQRSGYSAASERWTSLRLSSPEQRLLIKRYSYVFFASTNARDYQTLPDDAL